MCRSGSSKQFHFPLLHEDVCISPIPCAFKAFLYSCLQQAVFFKFIFAAFHSLGPSLPQTPAKSALKLPSCSNITQLEVDGYHKKSLSLSRVGIWLCTCYLEPTDNRLMEFYGTLNWGKTLVPMTPSPQHESHRSERVSARIIAHQILGLRDEVKATRSIHLVSYKFVTGIFQDSAYCNFCSGSVHCDWWHFWRRHQRWCSQ